MAATQSTIQIKFLQQPANGELFSYRINNNNIPLVYDQGLSLLNKTFRSSSTTNSSYYLGIGNELNIDIDRNPTSGFNSLVFTSAYQSTGKLIVGGIFTTYGGVNVNRVIRLNVDGTLDNTFSAPTMPSGNMRFSIDSSDRIVIGGSFTTPTNRILRLTADGAYDSSFVVGSGLNAVVWDVKHQADGKILVAGAFNTYNGSTRNDLIRLNTNGSVDTTFNAGSGSGTGGIFSIATTSDGKIYIGGQFTTYNGTAKNNIVRINTNGTIDTGFSVTTGIQGGGGFSNGIVYKILVDSTDKVYIGGDFGTFNGTTANKLIKLNYNGSVDTSFVVGSGFNAPIKDMVLKNGGYIIPVGSFTTYKGDTHTSIIKLDLSGTSIGVHNLTYNSTVESISYFSDTNISIFGYFTTIGDSNPASTQTVIPIGVDIATTQSNSYTNLTTFNTETSIAYSTSGDTIYVEYTHDDADVIFIDNLADIPGFVEIILPEAVFGEANLILAKSPHYNINTYDTLFDTAKIEISLWVGDYIDGLPLIPKYTFTKQIVQSGQDTLYFNVANYCRELLLSDIDNYTQVETGTTKPIGTSESIWVQTETTVYSGGTTEVDNYTRKYVAIDGYGWYNEGVNPNTPKVLMSADSLKVLKGKTSRLHFIAQGLTDIEYNIDGGLFQSLPYVDAVTKLNNEYISSHRIGNGYDVSNASKMIIRFIFGGGLVVEKKIEFVDECLYAGTQLIFKNKYGMLQSIPFELKSMRELSIDNKSYMISNLTQQGTYNPRKHSTVTYLTNGRNKYTLNSGYVNGDFNKRYEELLHSDEIYLEYQNEIIPVTITSKSWVEKTRINDKLIQYTMVVESANDTINQVI